MSTVLNIFSVDIISVTVRIGSRVSNAGGYTYETSLFSVHPRYNRTTFDHDVAVLRIPQGMTIDNNTTMIVDLVEGNTFVPKNTMLDVSGWGSTQVSSRLLSLHSTD